MKKPPSGSARTAGNSLESTIYTHPGFLARRLQQIAVSIFLEEMAGYDLTPVQYGVLAAVRAHPGIDQVGAGDRIGLDRTTVVGIVDRLQRKGLVCRRVDPADRRLRRLTLTVAGRQRLVASRAAVGRAQRRILDPLAATERARLVRAVARVIAHHNTRSRVPLTNAAGRTTVGGKPSRYNKRTRP